MIYLACPYTDGYPPKQDERVYEASRVTGMLMELGYTVFSPISYSHSLKPHEPADFNEQWYAFDLDFLRRCDVVAVLRLPGWDTSKGVRLEIEEARRLGMHIIYLDEGQCFDLYALSRRLSGDIAPTLPSASDLGYGQSQPAHS